MSRVFAYGLLVASAVLGAGSLLLFAVFLYAGPLRIVDLGLGPSGSLTVDAALCMAFFVQHSAMVRSGFRRRLALWTPAGYHAAVYSVVSGVFLIALIVLWQASDGTLFRAPTAAHWVFRGLFFLALAGLVWCERALGAFDALGLHEIRQHLQNRSDRQPKLAAGGPYRWVRHPIYSLVLVLLWTAPTLTPDRLLFNVLFTAWIFVGAVLEERDLVETFGDRYREYQRTVPMLVPYRRPR